jgi:hypothetical protein
MTYRLAALLVGAACALGGCSSAGIIAPVPDGGSSSLSFDATGPLTLSPNDMAVIDLSGMGVGSATISLAGNYLDAFLDADNVDLGSGHASITLQAPSSPTTFSVLASAGPQTARLDVSVSATGFATVRVSVDYEGKRPVPIVAASAFVETTCAQLAGTVTDGSPLVIGTYGEKLVIPSVPTDGRVAISVRIAHYATGCVDVSSLTPDETDDVTASVFDLPLDLADTTLETRFTFTPDTGDGAALTSYFEQYVGAAILAASFPSTSTDASHLLDAMAAASTSPTQFAAARSQKGWDGVVSTWLGQHTPSMHDRVSSWLQEAAQNGAGDLIGHLAGDPAKPVFTPTLIGTLDATKAGLSAPLPFAWSGQPNDVLSISGNVTIVPSQLGCLGADQRAQADVTQATGVADALVMTMDCTGLGSALAQGSYAFGQCDGACAGDLCSTAIANVWTAAAASLSKTSDSLTLSISVAAPVTVGDAADVEAYAGSWVGTFGYATTQIATKGVAKAANGTVPN